MCKQVVQGIYIATSNPIIVKMVPLMTAFVALSALFLCFFLVCTFFSYIPAISFTRDKLLDIRKYTPPDTSLVFIYSDFLLDIVVGRAAVMYRHSRMRRRGKQAGALVKLRQHGFQTALPSIHLANARINGEITRQRDVLLHQWEVVYRCNSVKEDVLFWSRNALH